MRYENEIKHTNVSHNVSSTMPTVIEMQIKLVYITGNTMDLQGYIIIEHLLTIYTEIPLSSFANRQ